MATGRQSRGSNDTVELSWCEASNRFMDFRCDVANVGRLASWDIVRKLPMPENSDERHVPLIPSSFQLVASSSSQVATTLGSPHRSRCCSGLVKRSPR